MTYDALGTQSKSMQMLVPSVSVTFPCFIFNSHMARSLVSYRPDGSPPYNTPLKDDSIFASCRKGLLYCDSFIPATSERAADEALS